MQLDCYGRAFHLFSFPKFNKKLLPLKNTAYPESDTITIKSTISIQHLLKMSIPQTLDFNIKLNNFTNTFLVRFSNLEQDMSIYI